MPLTVIVLTHNEIDNIERCLASLRWANQILVVDSGSNDGTVERAREMGVRVVFHEFEGYGSQRQWALECNAVRYDWVLFVDADEWVSAELASEVAEVMAAPACTGYLVRIRLIFQGRWIRHGGWYQGSWVVRLVDRRHVHLIGEFSERMEVKGTMGQLCNDIVDEDQKSFARWLEKHNRYSTMRAIDLRRWRAEPFPQKVMKAIQAKPASRIPRELLKRVVLPYLPLAPLWLFLYMYFLRGGFLDGRVGFWFCALHAFQELTVRIKVEEAIRRESTDTL